MTSKLKLRGNEHLTTFGANFKQLCLERAVKIKEILKRRALFGNQSAKSGASTKQWCVNEQWCF
jgi:hypothetical protein